MFTFKDQSYVFCPLITWYVPIFITFHVFCNINVILSLLHFYYTSGAILKLTISKEHVTDSRAVIAPWTMSGSSIIQNAEYLESHTQNLSKEMHLQPLNSLSQLVPGI